MPTYEYACTSCGHRLEAHQSFSDEPLTTCPECGGSLRKVFGSVGIVLKGPGFYRTDSRNGSSASKPSRDAGSKDAGSEKTGSSSGDAAASSSSSPSSTTSSGSGSTSSGSSSSGSTSSGSGSSSSSSSGTPAKTAAG